MKVNESESYFRNKNLNLTKASASNNDKRFNSSNNSRTNNNQKEKI